MPYDPMFNDTRDAIVQALTTLGYQPKRADCEYPYGDIITAIQEDIDNSAFVIADVSGENASVLYEVGWAGAMKKKVLFLTQDSRPFHVQAMPHVHYSPGDSASLTGKIQTYVKGWQKRGVVAFPYY